jgi:hypothetical protein
VRSSPQSLDAERPSAYGLRCRASNIGEFNTIGLVFAQQYENFPVPVEHLERGAIASAMGVSSSEWSTGVLPSGRPFTEVLGHSPWKATFVRQELRLMNSQSACELIENSKNLATTIRHNPATRSRYDSRLSHTFSKASSAPLFTRKRFMAMNIVFPPYCKCQIVVSYCRRSGGSTRPCVMQCTARAKCDGTPFGSAQKLITTGRFLIHKTSRTS